MINEKLTNVQKILTASNYLGKSIELSSYKYITFNSFLICTVPSEQEGTHNIVYRDYVGYLPLILDGLYVYDIYLSFYTDEHKELYTIMELEQSFQVKKCTVNKNGLHIRYPYTLGVKDLENIESVFDYWEGARNFYEEINHLKRVPNRYFYLGYAHQVIDMSTLQHGNFSYSLYQPAPHRVLFKCINELDLDWKDVFHTLVIELFKQTDKYKVIKATVNDFFH